MEKILKGDCLELMKGIPDGSVDMILCDLPYGTTKNSWDNVIPFDKLWQQYNRVIKERGAICLFGQEPFASKLRQSNLNMYRYDWTWIKESGTGFLNAKKMPLKNTETISVFYKKLPVYNPQMREGFKAYKTISGSKSGNYGSYNQTESSSGTTRYPVTAIRFNRDKNKQHPTQKPVALLEYLIKTYSNEGDLILDNAMGSGSTGVACVNTDRSFVGMELEDKYFDIAKERIEQAKEATSTVA